MLSAALLFLRSQRDSRLARSLLFLGIAYTLLAPWILRNYRLFHELVPSTTASGINLYIGNNPNATGSDRSATGYVLSSVPLAMQADLEAVPILPRYKIAIDPFLCIFASSAVISLQANLAAWMPARRPKEHLNAKASIGGVKMLEHAASPAPQGQYA